MLVDGISVGAIGLFLAGAVVSGDALAGRAHEHGAGRLDVAVDARTLTVTLETPLENLVGFERAPRTAEETQRVEKALATLRQGGQWLVPDPAAGCTVAAVEIESAALGLPPGGKPAAAPGGKPAAAPGVKPAASSSEHADLLARVDFRCADAGRAAQLEVGLFRAFPRLKRLDVQLATAKGQSRATLKPAVPRLTLAR